VTQPGGAFHQPPPQRALMLACDAARAKELVYARGLDLLVTGAATPIGSTCRLCERLDCTHRAFPPLGQPLAIDENSRALSPFDLARTE
jgi:predicted transcriptional regulator